MTLDTFTSLKVPVNNLRAVKALADGERLFVNSLDPVKSFLIERTTQIQAKTPYLVCVAERVLHCFATPTNGKLVLVDPDRVANSVALPQDQVVVLGKVVK